MQERIDKHDELLADLRVTVARLDERTKTIVEKLDQAVVARKDLEDQIAPIVESINKWRGALAMIALMAGSVGAAVTALLKRVFSA